MSLFEEVGLDMHGRSGRAAEAEVSEGMAASSVTTGESSNDNYVDGAVRPAEPNQGQLLSPEEEAGVGERVSSKVGPQL